jgi:hypothetical protein
MKSDLFHKLAQTMLLSSVWLKETHGTFESQSTPELPKLIIAPNHTQFRTYCIDHQLIWSGPDRQAIYVTESYHLAGIDKLADRLVILGYPGGERGYYMRLEIELRLKEQEARR